jgi:hypothetical protein
MVWMVALIVALAVALAWAAPAVEGSFEKTLSVSGPVQLRVATGAGGISVRRGPDSSVRVRARIRASQNWRWSEKEAAARVHEIEQNPPIRQTGNIITIGTEVQRWDNVAISYELTVPERTQVNAGSGSGQVEVYDLKGPADLHTGSGGIRAESIGGPVGARTGSGTINVMGAQGDVTASTGSGGLELSRIEGAVEAHTGSGHITISGATGRLHADAASGGVTVRNAQRDLEVRSGSGSITIDGTPNAAHWEAQTGSGGITVSLPAGTGFELDAHTGSGSVSTSHQVTVSGTIRRNELRGVVGKAGNLLRLRTGSGNIRVD